MISFERLSLFNPAKPWEPAWTCKEVGSRTPTGGVVQGGKVGKSATCDWEARGNGNRLGAHEVPALRQGRLDRRPPGPRR